MLDPSEVRRLSKLSPWRASLSLLQSWGVITCAIAVAVMVRHPIAVACSIVVIAIGQHSLGILMHEASHHRMYETRRLNDLVGKMCGTPIGVSMITYRVLHGVHHKNLYTKSDPDLALMAGYPRDKIYLFKKLLKDFFGVTVIKNFLYFSAKSKGENKERSNSVTKVLMAEDQKQVIIFHTMIALPFMIYTGMWKWYLLLWILPLFSFLQVILRLRAVCEHGATPDGVIGDVPADPRRAARTTLVGGWGSLLFPHEVNYHIEHHLYPSIPHYRLAECHRLLTASGALENAEVSPNLLETFRRITG